MQTVPFTPEIASQLKGLFQEKPPIPTRLWAILDGVIRGRILVDKLTEPKAAFIQDLTEGTVYFGGMMTAAVLRDAFMLLRSYQELVVCLWSDSTIIPMLPAGHTYDGIAIDFTNRSPAVDLNRLAAIPPGYEIRRIDAELAKKLKDFDDYYATMFGSRELAVQNSIGYCLMRGDTIASEAVAAPFTRGLAEMGVETSEAYRRKGLATVTSAYVIRECESLGYRPFWNAAGQNSASVALARRLGFQTEQPFRVLAWPVTQPFSSSSP